MDLNTFSRDPDQYRLFIASLSRPPGANPYGTRESNLRATLLFVRNTDTDYVSWADEQNLLELDVRDNPIFSWNLEDQAWYGATRYHPLGDLAVGKGPSGSVNLVVAVAGGLPFNDSDARWVECTKVGKVDGKSFCPSCDELFSDFRSLFAHSQTSVAASAPRSISARNRMSSSKSSTATLDSNQNEAVEPSKFSCTKTFRVPESVLESTCFAYVSTRAKDRICASGHMPASSWIDRTPNGTGQSPENHFAADSIDSANENSKVDLVSVESFDFEPTYIPCEFQLAPWSDGQIFNFSTHPVTKVGEVNTKGGTRTALLSLSLDELFGFRQSDGDDTSRSPPSHRKVFARIQAKGAGNFRTFTARLVVCSSSAGQSMLESLGFSQLDLNSNRVLWRSPSGSTFFSEIYFSVLVWLLLCRRRKPQRLKTFGMCATAGFNLV